MKYFGADSRNRLFLRMKNSTHLQFSISWQGWLTDNFLRFTRIVLSRLFKFVQNGIEVCKVVATGSSPNKMYIIGALSHIYLIDT